VATHTNGTDPEQQPTARKKRSRTRTPSAEPTIEIEDLLGFMRGATYAIERMLPALAGTRAPPAAAPNSIPTDSYPEQT
jgi:hypothetical protein